MRKKGIESSKERLQGRVLLILNWLWFQRDKLATVHMHLCRKEAR
jgi:hypothetical protein